MNLKLPHQQKIKLSLSWTMENVFHEKSFSVRSVRDTERESFLIRPRSADLAGLPLGPIGTPGLGAPAVFRDNSSVIRDKQFNCVATAANVNA